MDAAEEQPGNQQPDPDHETEQADDVDSRQSADALLPQRAEVGEHADREEGQDEKDDAEGVSFAHRGRNFGGNRRRGAEREIEADQERRHEAEDELREALPDLGRLRLILGDVDVVGPDVAEDEGPDADEDVDEHLHGGGGRENPAGLIFDAFGRILRQDQRLGDTAAGNRRAVGLHRKADPGAGHQRLVPQEGLRQERQDQHFDDREDDDQRRHQHRNRRLGADGAAGGDRGRHAADRNARRQRRRPFAVEAEPFAGDEVDHRPIDQIGLDDGGDAAQQQRAREIELARRRHRDEAAENDDGDLDVEFGADRGLDRFGETRQEIGDDQAGDQREDITAFVGKLERPVHAKLLHVGRRHRREIGVAADNPTGIGDPEYGGESEREALEIALEREHSHAQDNEQRDIGRKDRTGAAERGIGLGDRSQRLADIGPHRGSHAPSEQIDIGDAGERQSEDQQPDNQRQPVLADLRRDLDIVGASGNRTGRKSGGGARHRMALYA